jgi:hypothetical protein
MIMSSERAHDPGPTLGEILEGGQDLDRRTKLADGTREKIGAYLDAFDLRDSYGPDETNGSWYICWICPSCVWSR